MFSINHLDVEEGLRADFHAIHPQLEPRLVPPDSTILTRAKYTPEHPRSTVNTDGPYDAHMVL